MTPAFFILAPNTAHTPSMLRPVAASTGHRVEVFDRVPEALTAIAGTPVDLLVLDTAVSDQDPLSLVIKVRRRTTAQLIVLTEEARDLKRLRASAERLSIAAVLIRSTPASALQAFVRRLLLAPRPVGPVPKQRCARLYQRLLQRLRSPAPRPAATVTPVARQPQTT